MLGITLIYESIHRLLYEEYHIFAELMLATAIGRLFFNIMLATILKCSFNMPPFEDKHKQSIDEEENPKLKSIENTPQGHTENSTLVKKDDKKEESKYKHKIVAIGGGEGGGDENLNLRSAIIDVLGDIGRSFGSILAAIIILVFPKYQATDPIFSIVIEVIFLYCTTFLARDCINVFLEGKPEDLKINELKENLADIPGVIDVHDVHV